MGKFRVNDRQFRKAMKKLSKMPAEVMGEAGAFFKKTTPIDSGNARSNTFTKANAKNPQIRARYGYAARLDEGWSKQAPKGMSGPTEQEIDDLVQDYINNL